MNYERMWYKLKESLMDDVNTTDEKRKALIMDMLLEMNSIEIKEREDSEEELKLWVRKEKFNGNNGQTLIDNSLH